MSDAGPWEDCRRVLPYKDVTGKWQFAPTRTQRRKITKDGKSYFQYREREETDQEWSDRQW